MKTLCHSHERFQFLVKSRSRTNQTHIQILLPRHSSANLFMSSMTTTKMPLLPVTAVTGTAVIAATTAVITVATDIIFRVFDWLFGQVNNLSPSTFDFPHKALFHLI